MLYTIYTDGSCLKNPGGLGGYAAVIFREGEMIKELSGCEAMTTSNRMEITAAIVGLGSVREPSRIVKNLKRTFSQELTDQPSPAPCLDFPSTIPHTHSHRKL
jgi:ribonuclease HI